MSKKFHFCSCLGTHIQKFIAEKQSMGFKYITQSYLMQQFDAYWAEKEYTSIHLTPEFLDGWIIKQDSEGKAHLFSRVSVIREFSRYLNGVGIESYIPPHNVRRTRPLTHILCDKKARELFQQIDAYTPKIQNRANIRLSHEYPVLFRLIYSCGLRKAEACDLTIKQLDLAKGTLTLYGVKGNKDRIVYLADDMRQLCVGYLNKLHQDYEYSGAYVFPGTKTTDHVPHATVCRVFNKCWKQTSFAATCDVVPTVHSLRHTYVVKRINLWMQQGLNMNVMMPYLSRQLGHKGIDETYYYYHYVEESARVIAEKDLLGKKVIPEVKRR